MNNKLEIRTMHREELNTALDWAAEEGWNVGLRDSECFYAADPEGFLIATLDGQPVGCISAVTYEPHFGFIGLFIVRPELRGRGYGKRLWIEAMRKLNGRVAGLDAVTSREENYKAMGFKTAHRSTCNVVKARRTDDHPQEIKHLSQMPFAKACKLDRRHFPAQRSAFLDSLVRTPATHSYAYVTDGEIQGWGAIRECKGGWKIGPLYAETESMAEDLYDALQNSVPEDADIYINTPYCNEQADDFAKRHGMTPVFDTLRMYNAPEPHIEKTGIYGLASFELG